MEKLEIYQGVEQGPIRPPSEAESLLIRLTRNCSWNQCTFCPVYKGVKFSRRPVEHILQDIDRIKAYVEQIQEARQEGLPLSAVQLADGTQDSNAKHAAYHFLAGGMKSVFIQDGNSLILAPQDIIHILNYLRQAFPQIERVTSYARSRTLAKIADQDLLAIAQAGLNRIHIGMESGSDTVLKNVKKGVDKATQILAGQKVKRAGIQLSEYYMPGLGGKALSRENALETADALNQINPDFIRMRTLALPPAAPLTAQYQAGKFDKMGDVDTAKELLLFLETLTGITSTVRSDHILNLFPEVDGKLPEEKETMTQAIRDFLAMSAEDQLIFCIGRRTNRIARVRDMENPTLRANARQICDELGANLDNMDTITDAVMQRFI